MRRFARNPSSFLAPWRFKEWVGNYGICRGTLAKIDSVVPQRALKMRFLGPREGDLARDALSHRVTEGGPATSGFNMAPTAANLTTWAIAAVATAGVIGRPFRLAEAVWAVAGAALLVVLGLLPPADAWRGVGKGTDVYLFLVGMMLLSETARREGLFDWVAAAAVNAARGSRRRLFVLVYAVGVIVTAFLSNDATAVVLTPAVYAVSKTAKADPLPFLFICAFVANAASFLLPISNPANLVVFGDHMPSLLGWLQRFALPSALAVAATFAALRLVEGRTLRRSCAEHVNQPTLAPGGWVALAGIGLTAVALLAVSALGLSIGAPTCVMGATTVAVVHLRTRTSPWPLMRGVSWSVLPLVAGLFVLVEALNRSGLIRLLAGLLQRAAHASTTGAAAGAGGLVAVTANLVNNLPAGLIASATLAQAHAPATVTDAVLIGVDLGPNLSITGSLATILWLTAIRREGESVGFWRFLRVGALVMPVALIPALVARLLIG
jgi:arsenical pump membrane protein